MHFSLSNIPRSLVFGADLLLCSVSLLLAYLLRFNFDLQHYIWETVPLVFPIVLLGKAAAFYFLRTYAGILRYSSVEDLKKLFVALSGCAVILLAMQLVNNKVYGYQNFIPISVILIDYIASLSLLSVFRIAAKTLHYEWQHADKVRVRVIIFGAGEAGMVTYRTLKDDAGVYYKTVAFLDDAPAKAGNLIHGIPVYDSRVNLPELLSGLKADLLVLAVQNLPVDRKREVVDACLTVGIQVLVVPPVYKWINGELSFRQIREVRIEDILGRESIQLNLEQTRNQIKDKVVLITGAAGSIGSELARQIIPFTPRLLVLLDQAESQLYELELELTELHRKINFEPVLGDVRNEERMEAVFKAFKPSIVFHAAAYKHVPVIEDNPTESLLANILGTKIMADLAVKYRAEKFVLLSTDKAVNPTSVMGASKRICEIYTQSLGKYLQDANTRHTAFVTTRFGNVLGSTGSVIPRFKKQIREGGPVTVTHPEISRYFMTIQEACQLVLDAAAMGRGGEIYLFDMGSSIKIVDLAKKMIKLSGLTLGKDIQLVFTGLRQGEKLEEELFHQDENVIPTHHPKIMIANVQQYDYDEIRRHLQELVQLFHQQDNPRVILKMKQIVPEYISKNSVYEKLNLPPKQE
jgi:FlaA1/EpsC-like NDP-sugar epimerase